MTPFALITFLITAPFGRDLSRTPYFNHGRLIDAGQRITNSITAITRQAITPRGFS